MMRGVLARRSLQTVASFAEDSEYADVGAQVLDAAALVAPPTSLVCAMRYVAAAIGCDTLRTS